MVKSKMRFRGHELKPEQVFSLGTPVLLQNYIDNAYGFLFDLDGTLVITDQIYFVVWYEILINYNIVLDEEIFAKFVRGNNDKYVLTTLLKNVELLLEDLSIMKDELFIKNIDKIKVIDGVYDFIKKIKSMGHKICIVTNCNKNVADKIIKHIGLDETIDFIISSNDCIYGKPNCEPYSNAINKYKIKNSKCFIFEDSKTGILSGKQVSPKMLIGVETNYDNLELMKYGVDLSIKNYYNLDVNVLINDENSTAKYLKKLIEKNSTIGNIKEILLNEHKLKGGFIADVISYRIVTGDKTYSQIMKYENTQENNLSNMAKQLRLYEREYYFYTNISHSVNINIPKFQNLVFDKNNNAIGIVLDNLFEKGYVNNLNLNMESIDLTLKIVDRMAKMHSTFWNRDLKKMFPNVKGSSDDLFCPFFTNFINEKYDLFKTKWFRILNKQQMNVCDEIFTNFSKIQKSFSEGNNLTFIHGDIKSPNIFYDVENNNEPHFIDWQHCAIGKGVQDLVFFIIESFCITNIKSIFCLTKEYYYKKLLEYGVTNYLVEEYENDIYNAICYIPFFTSLWFGTISQDELIDKNFPYFLISKMFYLITIIKNK